MFGESPQDAMAQQSYSKPNYDNSSRPTSGVDTGRESTAMMY